jgi:hypothetical protein
MPVNTAPFAHDNAYNVDGGTTLTIPAPGILSNDMDDDGDPLTAILGDSVSNGVLTLNADDSFDYTPNTGFIGQDAFTYVANDGEADSNVAIVLLNVLAVCTVPDLNNPPVAEDDFYTIDEDTMLNGSVVDNDTDLDGDPLTATLIDGTDFGVLFFNPDGTFTYTPMTDYFGEDTFTYIVNDGEDDSNLATVTIEILPVEDPPICEPDPEADLVGWLDGDTTGFVTNNSDACEYIVGMASYSMPDDVIDHQTLFDSMHPVSVMPGETVPLSVQVPPSPCARQIDLFYGDLLVNLSGVRYGERLLDAVQIDAGKWCP